MWQHKQNFSDQPKVFKGEPFEERLRELEQCRLAGGYAGEVALCEGEVTELARVVARERRRPLVKFAVSGRFILLAVNCAYYKMEATGFWRSFCTLLGCQSDETTIGEFRRRSEHALQQWGFQDGPYHDGFRYVTPIRLQAGLTRHDLPTFARLLDTARATHGWAGMLRMPHAEFLGFLHQQFTVRTKFAQFLEDENGGTALTRAVLKDLVRWQQGLLGHAPYPCGVGYRPGFWEELWPHLHGGVVPARIARPACPSAAKFIFDATSAQFGLLFPQTLVNQRACRLAGSNVYESFLPLKQINALRHAYSVEVKMHSDEWLVSTLPGWVPSAENPYALFLPTGDLLPLQCAAEAGIYSLVSAAPSIQLPACVTCLTDFEYVDVIPPTLRYWQIELAADSDPAALGYRRGAARESVLEWTGQAQLLRGAADAADVFLGRLPALQIDHAADFREKRRVLCCEHGAGTEVVPIPAGGEKVELSLPCIAPCTGGCWVETLGRSRFDGLSGAEERLSFCLLPPCEISWPEGLYTPEAEPAIRFSTAANVTADFLACEQQNAGTWTVPPYEDWVEGEVRAGAVSARVAWRIYRAAVEDESGRPFFAELGALPGSAKLRVRGLPETPVRLGVRGRGAAPVEIIQQQLFDGYGVAAVSSQDLLDALRLLRDEPVLGLEVWSGSEWVRTGGQMVDFVAIERWLFDPAREPSPDWLTAGGKALAALLAELARMLDASSSTILVPVEGSSPVARWAKELLVCATAFSRAGDRDRSGPTIDLAVLTPARRRVLEWVEQAEQALGTGSADPAELAARYPGTDALPAWAPWHLRVDRLRDRLRAAHDLESLLQDWRDDVVARGFAEPRSALGAMSGGGPLTTAYIHNYAGRYHQAYRNLGQVPADAPEIIRGLRSLLETVLRVQEDAGPGESREPGPRRLRPLLAGLRSLAGWASPLDLEVNAAEAVAPEILPLRKEQTSLLHDALARLPGKNINDLKPSDP